MTIESSAGSVSSPDQAPGVASAEFFVLRAPLLPIDAFEAFGAGLSASATPPGPQRAAALERDRRKLRSRLRDAIDRPEIREALFVASPSLEHGIDRWLEGPEDMRGARAERGLVRYLARMSCRPTPFGLFAGCATGATADASHVEIPPVHAVRRRSRIDLGYLNWLCSSLAGDEALRAKLRLYPNSSLYRVAGQLRYVQIHATGPAVAHRLVGARDGRVLTEVLERAHAGATVGELVAVAAAEGMPVPRARVYVEKLIEAQLLTSELAIPLTGEEPLDLTIATLRARGADDWVARLEAVRAQLRRLDRGGTGNPRARYRTLAASMGRLPSPPRGVHLVQVDMVRPGTRLTLGRGAADKLLHAVETLATVTPRERGLSAFREAFMTRHGWGFVPLAHALDRDLGVAVLPPAGSTPREPLIRDLPFPPPAGAKPAPDQPDITWGTRERHLLARLTQAIARGASEIELTDADMKRLAGDDPPILPDAFAVCASLAARSPAALADGDFEAYVRGAMGPSGVEMLGRFCHADPELRARCERHLRAEEALQPDAIFAEVVHLPEGRQANVIARPLLREWEIPYLTRSGARADRQLSLDDLYVGVRGGRTVLWSRRHGRRVIPRLSCAHNHRALGSQLYRFLCLLETEFSGGWISWSWGPLDAAPFLPRVRLGRAVFSRARWRLSEEEVAELWAPDANERFDAVQRLRDRRDLPRVVTVIGRGQELAVDLDNALSVEAFAWLARERRQLRLSEMWPSPSQLCARGAEGRYVSEIVVPFIRSRSVERPSAASLAGLHLDGARGRLAPGSDWLYVKLYVGPTIADQVLLGISNVVSRLPVDRWFFIRYFDGEHHLRLRLHGEPTALRGVLTTIVTSLEPLMADGRVARVAVEAYEPEIERYGGPSGAELAERIFHVDTVTVLELLGELDAGGRGGPTRWQLAICSVDRLLHDLVPDAEAARTLLEHWSAQFARKFGVDRRLRLAIGRRLREHQVLLDGLLSRVEHAGASGDAGPFPALRERSWRLAPLLVELTELERTGHLGTTVQDIAYSYVHMHLNRLLRDEQPAQEMIIYDFLLRLRASRAARRHARRRVGQAPAGVASTSQSD